MLGEPQQFEQSFRKSRTLKASDILESAQEILIFPQRKFSDQATEIPHNKSLNKYTVLSRNIIQPEEDTNFTLINLKEKNW